MSAGRKNMTTYEEAIMVIDRLPPAEKWRLVKHVLDTLEQEQVTPLGRPEYLQRLRETYGSLRDTPIDRGDQGDYEEREPLT
jgi:hypothetical protein